MFLRSPDCYYTVGSLHLISQKPFIEINASLNKIYLSRDYIGCEKKWKSLSFVQIFATPWTTPSIQSLSHVQLFATLWTAECQVSLSFTKSWRLLRLMSIELVIPSNHLILCCPLLLLPSIFPSNRVFANESVLCIRWPKDWSFSFNISPYNEHSGLISFRMDWLDLLAVQGTLKSLLQHHSSKVSILQH